LHANAQPESQPHADLLLFATKVTIACTRAEVPMLV